MNEQFRHEMFDLHFVLAADFLTLTVHSIDIGFVSVTQLVHPLNQVISLAGQLLQLLIHQLLLLASLDLLMSQSFKLVIKLG